jgi:hypothetical protein
MGISLQHSAKETGKGARERERIPAEEGARWESRTSITSIDWGSRAIVNLAAAKYG